MKNYSQKPKYAFNTQCKCISVRGLFFALNRISLPFIIITFLSSSVLQNHKQNLVLKETHETQACAHAHTLTPRTHTHTHTSPTLRSPVGKPEAVNSGVSDPEGISFAEMDHHRPEDRPGSHQIKKKAQRLL